jgi:putative ABC transport system permease protein
VIRLKVALLNLLRNKRRSVFSLANLVIALAVVLLFEGFAESMYDGLRESMIRSQLGHVQIYAKGFNRYGALNDAKILLSESTKAEIVKQAASVPGVILVASRLESDALITDGEAQMAVTVIGIDADKEATISSAIRVLSGTELFSQQEDGVLLGGALADALGVKVGSTLTILGTSANQTLNAIDVSVVGTITTGVRERDARTVFANTALMEKFLLSKGATRIVLLLDETSKTGAVKEELTRKLAMLQQPVELRGWSELAPYYHQVVGLFSAIFLFAKIILLLVAGLAVSNALSMSVVERTREIGVIRAIGGSRIEICSLFLLEGGFLGVAGGLLGVGAGLALTYALNRSGLMMPTPPGSTVNYPLRILVSPSMLYWAFLLGTLVAVLSSVLPALRAARLNIVTALGHA